MAHIYGGKEGGDMDVNNTYMILNTENNVHTDGKYHKKVDTLRRNKKVLRQ